MRDVNLILERFVDAFVIDMLSTFLDNVYDLMRTGHSSLNYEVNMDLVS